MGQGLPGDSRRPDLLSHTAVNAQPSLHQPGLPSARPPRSTLMLALGLDPVVHLLLWDWRPLRTVACPHLLWWRRARGVLSKCQVQQGNRQGGLCCSGSGPPHCRGSTLGRQALLGPPGTAGKPNLDPSLLGVGMVGRPSIHEGPCQLLMGTRALPIMEFALGHWGLWEEP